MPQAIPESGQAQPTDHPAALRAAAVPPGARPPVVDSAWLLQGHPAVEIVHQGVIYRLQATRLGKLILTK